MSWTRSLRKGQQYLTIIPGARVGSESIGSLGNNNGDSYENVTKKWIYAASNFIALIPSRLIR